MQSPGSKKDPKGLLLGTHPRNMHEAFPLSVAALPGAHPFIASPLAPLRVSDDTPASELFKLIEANATYGKRFGEVMREVAKELEKKDALIAKRERQLNAIQTPGTLIIRDRSGQRPDRLITVPAGATTVLPMMFSAAGVAKAHGPEDPADLIGM